MFAASTPATVFQRQQRLSAVRMNYAELMDVLQKCREVANTANGVQTASDSQSTPNESLQLSDGVQSVNIELSDKIDLRDIADRSFPLRSTSVKYSYRSRNSLPISDVRVELSDFLHWISVEGSDLAHVDACMAILEKEFFRHRTFFGGWAISFLVFMGCVVFSVLSLLGVTQGANVQLRVLSFVLMVFFLSISFSGLIGEAFPNCYVSNEAGWLIEHNALFTFLSLLLGVLTIIPMFRQKSQPSVASK
jgi:hypothetical protein